MKASNLIWIGLLAGGIYFYSKFRSLSHLQFVLRNVGFASGGLSLLMGVQNPTGDNLQLNSIFGSILVNGQPVGNIASPQPTAIKGNSETPIQLLISSDPFGVIGLALQQINSGTPIHQTVELDGTANVSGSLIPIHIKIL